MKNRQYLKVAGFFLLTLAVFLSVLLWLTHWNPLSTPYRFTVLYRDVYGLKPGDRVQLLGVRIGRVVNLRFEPALIYAEVEIDSDQTRIWRESIFSIGSAGVTGRKVINIIPAKELLKPERMVQVEEWVMGERPSRLDTTFAQVMDGLKNFRDTLDNPRTRKLLWSYVTQARAAADKAEAVLSKVEAATRVMPKHLDAVGRVVTSGGDTFRVAAARTQAITADLRRAADSLQGFVGSYTEGEPLEPKLRRYRNATAAWVKTMEGLEQQATDPALKAQIRQGVGDMRQLLQRYQGMMKVVF